MLFRRCLPFAFLLLPGCVAASARPASDAGAPPFAPISFFSGRTEGTGTLKVIMSHPRVVHIVGNGRPGADGGLVLVQRIEQDGKAPRTRQWSLRPTGLDTYNGVLSDAVGPIRAVVVDGVLHIRFKAKGSVAIEQWLALEPGGRVARNHLVVRKFGVRVAVLDETIRKIE